MPWPADAQTLPQADAAAEPRAAPESREAREARDVAERGEAATSDEVQEFGERFVRLYYGLLAVRPSAVAQFYHEGSQLSRSFAAPAEAGGGKRPAVMARGLAEIREAIMQSVGGKDPGHSAPVVVTNVTSVQSSALVDQRGIMSQITGYITYIPESKVRHFCQTVFLEPSGADGSVLYVRNDIVHYTEEDSLGAADAPMTPGVAKEEVPHAEEEEEEIDQVVHLAAAGEKALAAEAPPSPLAPASTAPTAAAGTAAPRSAPVSWASRAAAAAGPSAAAPKPGGSRKIANASMPKTVRPVEPAASMGEAAGEGAAAAGDRAEAERAAPPAATTLPPPAAVEAGGGPSSAPAPAAAPATRAPAAAPASAPDSPAKSPVREPPQPRVLGGERGLPGSTSGVKLWVSGLPTEASDDTRGRECRGNPVRAREIMDALNQALREHAPHISGEVTEVDRKDERKAFAFAQVSEERAAKELVVMSKLKKVTLRGEKLVLDLSNYNTARVETLYTGGPSSNWSRWDRDDDRASRRKGAGKGSGGGENRSSGGGKGWKGGERR